MDASNLFVCNCDSCHCWAVTEFELVDRGLRLRCTHCNASRTIEGPRREVERYITTSKRFAASTSGSATDLSELRTIGDFMPRVKRK